METIPKIIHYCWFGKNQLTDISRQCMESWEKTGYEIKLWNEDNIVFNDYLDKCCKKKKYANMSNYIRMVSIYENGGIYLDTDVEIIGSLGSFDSFLKDKMFLGWEGDNYINNAIWGSIKGHSFLKKCIEEFKFDGEEAANLSSPHFLTRMIKQEYNMVMNDKTQIFDDLVVYAKEYFYPYGYYEIADTKHYTSNTVAVHKWEKKW